MTFDAVVLSTNLDPLYWPFFPYVARAWQKLFSCPVHLAVVGNPRLTDQQFFQGPGEQRAVGRVAGYPELRDAFGQVHWLNSVPGVPEPNQAKLARYYLASSLPANTRVLLHDIDYLPLSRAQINAHLDQRPFGTLLMTGTELYTGPETGKAMAGSLLAESMVFIRLFSPTHLGWPTFIESLKGRHQFDNKEDILNAIDHQDPNTFSDESLLRALRAERPVPVLHRPAFTPDRTIDRSHWHYDPTKLAEGYYAGAHLTRPLNLKDLDPLLHSIGCDHAL